MIEPATWGALAALGSSCTWAVGSSVYSRISQAHSPVAVNFARAWIALPLFVLASGAAEYAQLAWGNVGWMTLSMFASYGFGDVIFLWSTRSIGVPGALAIASSYPLWTAWAGVALKGESMSGPQLLGLCVTVLGLVTVILNAPRQGVGGDSPVSRPAVGICFAFLTSFFWALNSYSVSQGMEGITSPVGNTVRMAIGIVMSFVLSRILRPRQPVVLPGAVLRKFWPVFAIESFGGSFFYLTAFAQAPLVIAATLTSLAPVLSVPVAWTLGIEKFSPWRTFGVALVVLGLWLLVNFRAY